MPKIKKKDRTIFLLGKLYQVLNSKRKFEIKLIILTIVFNGLLEIFSIGSLVPLITLISSPTQAKNILIDYNLYGKLWLTSSNSTLIISLLFLTYNSIKSFKNIISD